MNNLTKKCNLCKIPCKDCLADYEGLSCTSCLNGYFEYSKLQNSPTIECLLRCPTGYYKNSTIKPQCIICL